MSRIKVTTKTRAQIAAEFAESFKGLTPDEAPKRLTEADRLAPYRGQVMKERRRGFSWQLIADRMSLPPINEKVTAKLLKRFFGAIEKKPKAARKPRKTPTKPKPTPKPPLPRLVLDRATGLPITPAPAAPDSSLPAQYQSVFDRVAPKIIRMGYVGDVAQGMLGEAVVTELHSEVEQTNAFIEGSMAQLDTLDRDTAIAKYAIKPADWDDWRTKWCKLRDL